MPQFASRMDGLLRVIPADEVARLLYAAPPAAIDIDHRNVPVGELSDSMLDVIERSAHEAEALGWPQQALVNHATLMVLALIHAAAPERPLDEIVAKYNGRFSYSTAAAARMEVARQVIVRTFSRKGMHGSA